MNKYLNFEISNVQIVENRASSKFTILQVDVCRSGENSHRLPITKQAIRDSANSVKGVPILTKIRFDGQDFMGHEIDEIAVGYFTENEPEIIEKDGQLYIRTTAKIWKAYYDNVVEILQKKEGKTDVSMEMEVLKGEEATPFKDGIIELFCIIGVTLLGVNPSIKGAQATVLSFAELKEIGDEEDNTIVSKLEQFANDRKNMAQTYKVNETTLKDTPWGEVDKTELRNKVMEASNRDSLVRKVYALVEDGWQDSPSEHLKYPLMELVGDTFYYNRYALSSALAYAKQENESSVISKVEGLYNKFNLDDKEDEKMAEKFTDISFEEIDASVMKFGELNGRKIYDEVIKKVKEKLGDHMFVKGIYDNKIVVEDYDKKELVDIPAKIKVGKDDEAMSIDIDYDKMKKSTVQHDFAQDDDIDDKDDDDAVQKAKKDSVPDDDDDEGSDEDAEEFCKQFSEQFGKIVKMGLDAQAYAGAVLEMLKAETVDEIKAAKRLGDDEDLNLIMDEMCDMACERFELKEYKQNKEKEEFSEKITKVLAEVKDDIDDKDFEEFQKKIEECQFAEEASQLVNTIRAFAYEKSKGKKVRFSQEEGIIRMQLPKEKDTAPKGDVFDRIMNK